MKFDGFSSREAKRSAGRPRKKFPDFFGFFSGEMLWGDRSFFIGYFARTTSVVVFGPFSSFFVGRCRAWHITVKKIKKAAIAPGHFFKEMHDLSNAPSGVSGTAAVRA